MDFLKLSENHPCVKKEVQWGLENGSKKVE